MVDMLVQFLISDFDLFVRSYFIRIIVLILLNVEVGYDF